MDKALIAALQEVGQIRLDEPMSRHTTFGVGGPADAYVVARTEEQLSAAFTLARSHGSEVFVFGSGSNILVGDGGFRGVVIENRNTKVVGPTQNGVGHKVRVGSGMSFSTLARRLAGSGFAGLEWACGIPGSLGGAVVTNAGAYGHALSDVLVTARTVNAGGAISELTPGDLDLAYRSSAMLRGELPDIIVLSVDLRVNKGDAVSLKATIREYDSQRRKAQPAGRNCGSVFKNPPDRSAWQYVDEVGLRGHRIGNAQFSEVHSNFIQNLGGATASDIASLVQLAQERIREQFGLEITPEVVFIGEFATGGAV
jgi:UDP-N-acetylmuramate dehydrogenase